MENNSQSRKYQLTINNPAEKGITRDTIKQSLAELSTVYWAISDEIGIEEHTPHTHVFVMLRSPVRFSRMKRLFPTAHIEVAHGTAAENKAYIEKSGKWADTEKQDTSIPGTFEESGELPSEPEKAASVSEAILSMIADGASNAEIITKYPTAMNRLQHIEAARQTLLGERFRDTWRTLEITYIWGETGSGKTKSVMEEYGYGNVYQVTNYLHPFDTYSGQDVLLLDEFRSSIMAADMLKYLDGYPLMLPCRYADKVACFTKIYIVSNIPLEKQYPNVQIDELATWKAFLRRIHHVVEFRKGQAPIDHGNAMDYIYPPPEPVPDWVREAEQCEQATLPL